MIAVIIPMYHVKDTICDCLDSLVSQTKKRFFVVPSIDGDGEDYTEIFDEYRSRGLNILPIISEENGGPGIARQRAIDATGKFDYITFLDADDLLMPRAIEVMTDEITKNFADIVVFDFMAEKSHEPAMYLSASSTPVTWCHGKVYRRKFLVDNNIRFLPDFRINEDSYFNLVACNCAKNKFRVAENVYLWRDNKNSITRNVEGRELFERVCQTYINTQIFGIQKIIDISGNINTLTYAATLINIYKHMMKQRYYKIENINYIQNFSIIRQNRKLQEKFKDINFWNYLEQTLTQCEKIDNNFFFYKMNFMEFLKQYIFAEDTEI